MFEWLKKKFVQCETKVDREEFAENLLKKGQQHIIIDTALTPSRELWLVEHFAGGVWDARKQDWGFCDFEISGIFDSEEKAIAACRDHNYAIMPLVLNAQSPEERFIHPRSYYPKAKKEGDKVDN